MGWKAVSQVSQYNNLQKIAPEAWQIIARSVRASVSTDDGALVESRFTDTRANTSSQEEGPVKNSFTTVKSPFNEYVLREIVPLTGQSNGPPGVQDAPLGKRHLFVETPEAFQFVANPRFEDGLGGACGIPLHGVVWQPE
jgi:hypothetical protein